MARFRKGVLDIGLGVLISIVIALFGFYIVYHIYFTASSGSVCWEKALTQMESIQTAFNELANVKDSKSVFVDFGPCTDGVAFMNKDQLYSALSESGSLANLKSDLGCADGYDAFIVAAPTVEDAPSLIGGLKDFTLYSDASKVQGWGKNWILNKANIKMKPVCKNVPITKAVFDRTVIKEMGGLGGKYCVVINRLENLKYTILSFEKVTSKEQCKLPEG
ncbi:MAG TPA: hypothetical protein VJA47_04685 [archaeon]|nr:hypothetical protein [archaeon]